MSKFNAALVTLMLGSSTAAMASPGVSFSADAQFSWGNPYTPTVRDHRGSWDDRDGDSGYYARPSRGTTWISLGEPLRFDYGRDVIRPQLGTFTQIRLQAASGVSFVQSVTVRFTDGGVQRINFNQWLTNRNPMLQFDLEAYHRGIDAIIVRGTAAGRGGSYQVFAQGTRTVQMPRPTVPSYEIGGYYHQPAVEQQPLPPPVPAPVVNRTPIMLSSELHFANTQGYRQIYVANQGPFSVLRLQGHMGATPISHIEITFTNGQTQTIGALSHPVMPGEVVDLRLDPRGNGQISQIFVFTNDTLTPIPNAITSEVDVLAL